MDADGHVVAGGIVVVQELRDHEITGLWYIRPGSLEAADYHSEQFIGPQTGSGVISGKRRLDRLEFTTNPDVCDNDVSFSGNIERRKVSGNWQHRTLAGIRREGRFELKC